MLIIIKHELAVQSSSEVPFSQM